MYLMNPVDLIPDFIPVIGLLEDAVIAAFVLRLAVRWIPRELIDELWDGDMSFDEAFRVLARKARRRKKGSKGVEAPDDRP